MPIAIESISDAQADRLIRISEGQFSDVKAIEIAPAKLTKHISALANSDGGDLYIGIAEVNDAGVISREWAGFANEESANGHLQVFEQLFPLARH
jgi:ATP-dependent DNA helicase RecG